MANDADAQHEHRWWFQGDEDEPQSVHLVCAQCGEVVDPAEFLALRTEVEQLRAQVAQDERIFAGAAMSMEGINVFIHGQNMDVTSLREQNAAAREIVQEVARYGESYGSWACIFRGECEPVWNVARNDYDHAPDCFVTKAREWVEKYSENRAK